MIVLNNTVIMIRMMMMIMMTTIILMTTMMMMMMMMMMIMMTTIIMMTMMMMMMMRLLFFRRPMSVPAYWPRTWMSSMSSRSRRPRSRYSKLHVLSKNMRFFTVKLRFRIPTCRHYRDSLTLQRSHIIFKVQF